MISPWIFTNAFHFSSHTEWTITRSSSCTLRFSFGSSAMAAARSKYMVCFMRFLSTLISSALGRYASSVSPPAFIKRSLTVMSTISYRPGLRTSPLTVAYSLSSNICLLNT